MDKPHLLKYNIAMSKENLEDAAVFKEKPNFFQGLPRNLEISLVELTTALIEHAKHLERHISTMENLTRALKQLDATIKKEVSLESSQPSVELKEAITSFLEHNINPKYYHDSGYLKLAAPQTRTPEMSKKSKHQKAP